MTLAASLAHIVCIIDPGGDDVDPLLPLVLGDQPNQNYSVQSYDLTTHVWQLQAIQQLPDDTFQQSSLMFDNTGALLINGQPLINAIPEISGAVAAASASAVQSGAYATAAEQSNDEAEGSAIAAAAAAESSNDSAVLASNYAATASASAATAADLVLSSRFVPRGAAVVGNETYAATFLNTRRRVTASGLVTVTIPVGIYSSLEDKEALGLYRLEGTGSVRFVPAAGGSVPIAPVQNRFQRYVSRVAQSPADALTTRTFTVAVPAIAQGRIAVVVHAQIAGTTGHVASISSAPAMTWATRKAMPAAQTDPRQSNFAIFETTLTAFAAGNVDITVRTGNQTQIMTVGVHIVDGVTGAMILPATFAENGPLAGTISSMLAAVPAQSLVIADTCCRGTGNSSPVNSLVGFSNNIAIGANGDRGDSIGQEEVTVSSTNVYKNSTFGSGEGVAASLADFTVTATYQATGFSPDLALFAYPPIIGSVPATTLRLKGGTVDTLNVRYGEAQLWFHPNGTEVFINIDT